MQDLFEELAHNNKKERDFLIKYQCVFFTIELFSTDFSLSLDLSFLHL